MILKALYDLAQDEGLLGDPDFEMRPVAWLVRVGPGGKLLGIEGTHQTPDPSDSRKRKPQAKSFLVPRLPTGRSGTKAPAAFLVDNAKYVFGLATANKAFDEDEGREKASWFREKVVACAEATGDAGAGAVSAFLEGVAERAVEISLPAEAMSNDLFAFIYGPDVDRLVHQRTAVLGWWKAQRSTMSEGPEARCVVTGNVFRGVPLFPLIRRVPGGQSSGSGVVSFNQSSFESYGWSGNGNAPISREAAEACATALNRLLNPDPVDQLGRRLGRRSIVVSDDTVVCYWARGRDTSGFLDVLGSLLTADDPEMVGELYKSLWSGHPVELPGDTFYAVTLSGSQGRVILRDWFETSVTTVSHSLAKHFADLAIVRLTPPPKGKDRPPRLTLGALLESLAPNGKREEIPGPVTADLIAAALRDRPYPFAMLVRAVERARAEVGRTEWADLYRRDARAALIKAVLRRLPNPKEVTYAMDPYNEEPGYVLGRLLAVLERLQQAAMRDVNASVVDRYFGAASATPRVVFPRLLKSARYHARKALDDDQQVGTANWLERQLDDIVARFRPGQGGFPAYLDAIQQGLFVLGYHHQRHWLWMDKEQRAAWASEHNVAASAA